MAALAKTAAAARRRKKNGGGNGERKAAAGSSSGYNGENRAYQRLKETRDKPALSEKRRRMKPFGVIIN
jgi:hypothetical protein